MADNAGRFTVDNVPVGRFPVIVRSPKEKRTVYAGRHSATPTGKEARIDSSAGAAVSGMTGTVESLPVSGLAPGRHRLVAQKAGGTVSVRVGEVAVMEVEDGKGE
jgi:hypothetical protein